MFPRSHGKEEQSWDLKPCLSAPKACTPFTKSCYTVKVCTRKGYIGIVISSYRRPSMYLTLFHLSGLCGPFAAWLQNSDHQTHTHPEPSSALNHNPASEVKFKVYQFWFGCSKPLMTFDTLTFCHPEVFSKCQLK